MEGRKLLECRFDSFFRLCQPSGSVLAVNQPDWAEVILSFMVRPGPLVIIEEFIKANFHFACRFIHVDRIMRSANKIAEFAMIFSFELSMNLEIEMTRFHLLFSAIHRGHEFGQEHA